MNILKKSFVILTGVALAVGAVVALSGMNAQAISSYRDCEDDTIIKCGALSESELLQHYDNNVGDVQHIYAHYGINRSDLAGTTSTIKHGTVYQDGTVKVDGEIVATNASSLSRLPFSDKSGNKPNKITINGATLYEGPNMSIFLQPVDAFIFFRDGQFYKAILSACGNTLVATPTPKPEKPVTPEVPTTPETPIVPETPVTPVVPSELPKTGLESFIGGGLGTGLVTASVYYWTSSRKKLADTLRNR